MFNDQVQAPPQKQDPSLVKWMEAMYSEQKRQTSLLSNLRSVAYFFFVLAFLSMLGGCCIALGGASTLTQIVSP